MTLPMEQKHGKSPFAGSLSPYAGANRRTRNRKEIRSSGNHIDEIKKPRHAGVF